MVMFPVLAFGSNNACSTDILAQLRNRIDLLSLKPLEESRLDDTEYVKKRIDTLSQIEIIFREEQYARCVTKEYISMVDNQNKIAINELKQILTKHLWITIPKFGFKTSENAWIIVQHAMHDPAFQHQALFLMEYCLPNKEVDPLHYANLYDRVTIHYNKLGMKQRYGTQSAYNDEEKKFELLPYNGNFESLKKNRANIGLLMN